MVNIIFLKIPIFIIIHHSFIIIINYVLFMAILNIYFIFVYNTKVTKILTNFIYLYCYKNSINLYYNLYLILLCWFGNYIANYIDNFFHRQEAAYKKYFS